MSDEEDFKPTPEETRARDAVRSLSPLVADSAFRERLKADFVAGRLGGESEAPAAAPAPRRSRRWMTVFAPGVAILALIVFALLYHRPSFELADVRGEGSVTIDGRTFASPDRRKIALALHPGSHVELTRGVVLDAVYRGVAVFELDGARASLPGEGAPWTSGPGRCRVDTGEMRLLTGASFHGGMIEIDTPQGIVHVTGTSVSVVCTPELTCVCVHEGTAQVGIHLASLEPVPAGMRKVMYADGSRPLVTSIAPEHEKHLAEFEARYRAQMKRK